MSDISCTCDDSNEESTLTTEVEWTTVEMHIPQIILLIVGLGMLVSIMVFYVVMAWRDTHRNRQQYSSEYPMHIPCETWRSLVKKCQQTSGHSHVAHRKELVDEVARSLRMPRRCSANLRARRQAGEADTPPLDSRLMNVFESVVRQQNVARKWKKRVIQYESMRDNEAMEFTDTEIEELTNIVPAPKSPTLSDFLE